MDEIQAVEDIKVQNEYIGPVDTVEMLNKYEKFKVDLFTEQKQINRCKKQKTRRELRIIMKL